MEIFAADDESSVHLSRDDGAGEDTSADRDFASERAFLVYRIRSALRLFQSFVLQHVGIPSVRIFSIRASHMS